MWANRRFFENKPYIRDVLFAIDLRWENGLAQTKPVYGILMAKLRIFPVYAGCTASTKLLELA